jgi:hypothetical protein
MSSGVARADVAGVTLLEAAFDGRCSWAGSPSLAATRQLVADVCASCDQDAIDDIMLVASEIVTNAARYAHGPIELSIRRETETVFLAVDDRSDAVPTWVDTPGAHGGYGLRIIERTSLAWGTVPQPYGKTVWARIPVTTARRS